MTPVLLWVNWLNLRRDAVALGLCFLLPIVFYSIFAAIFGGRGQNPTSRVHVVVVDEDGTDGSRRLVEALRRIDAVRLRDDALEAPTREAALETIRSGGAVRVAIVIRAGFAESFGDFADPRTLIDVLADTSDPVAPQIVGGLLQKAAMTALPDLMVRRGVETFERYAGGLTEAQRAAVEALLPRMREWVDEARPFASADDAPPGESDASTDALFGGLVGVRIIDVLGRTKRAPMIAFYAAGTAVMFLLFSASGAGGALLEEEESGVLQRTLGSNVSMTGLLASKWLFLTLMGVAQVTLMFLWGALVFQLDLFTPMHLAGFAVMTLVTAAAAAAFGLVLAAACRSRAQLGGLSTIVILIMSALGGSMFPRFLMPEWVQHVGYFTFNAWALDGYQKVFWYDEPVTELGLQVSVLVALMAAFLGAARLLARRWEAA